jgi:ankyrin repeat protein
MSRALAESFEQWGRLPLDDRLLHQAVEDRDHQSLASVISHFSPNLESEPPDGIRVLARAAQRGDTESIALLMARSKPNARDQLGMTPLMWACKLGHDKAAMMLLDASDPMAVDARGRTAADHARGARPRLFAKTIEDWQRSGLERIAIASSIGEQTIEKSEPPVQERPRSARTRL